MGLREETGEFQLLTAQKFSHSLRDPVSEDMVTRIEEDDRHFTSVLQGFMHRLVHVFIHPPSTY